MFGAYQSPLVVLCMPAAVLTGMAFAGPIAAFSATQKNPNRFATIFRFGITPLFLFSGTFFPVTSLPAALQVLAWLTPLYHGVALTRSLSLGTVGGRPGRDGRPPRLPRDAGRSWAPISRPGPSSAG